MDDCKKCGGRGWVKIHTDEGETVTFCDCPKARRAEIIDSDVTDIIDATREPPSTDPE